jgi:hypothetical protein
MAGLVPAIHAYLAQVKQGRGSPGMTSFYEVTTNEKPGRMGRVSNSRREKRAGRSDQLQTSTRRKRQP